MTFCDEVVDYFPARKGKGNVLRMIRELVSVEPMRRKTDIGAALEYISRVQKRRAVIFLLSDFLDPKLPQKEIAICARRHDLVGIHLTDPREVEMPDVGIITLMDAETGQLVTVDTHDRQVRGQFAANATRRAEAISQTLRRLRGRRAFGPY